MPLFSSAQNFVLNDSHLTDITLNNSAGPTGIDVLFESSIPEATYDSSARDPPPRCFPNTREQYVEDIVNWVLPTVNDTPLPICWMKGLAGVGKSAVAQTCAEKLRRLRKLDNNISTNNRGEHYKFFTSIAYQISTVYPNYRNLLNAKIRHDKSLIDKTMESQFWELIVEPLQELEEKGLGIGKRIPVFVDGPDECESLEAQCDIIDIVAAAARDGTTPLCWAFFSRPEPHIEATFSRAATSPLCHNITLPISRDADGDIELYLRASFEDIVQRLNIVMVPPWPSDRDLKKLVHAAGGLFIYAKTVLRFVGQLDSLNPEESLRVILSVISNRNQHNPDAEPAFAELDAFYVLIMQRIPVKMFPTIHRVLSVLCLGNYASAITVANFLGISRVELEAACHQVTAVVHFQHQHKPLELNSAINTGHSFLRMHQRLTVEAYNMILRSLGGSISFYHKSFKDLLLDPHRSGNYCISTTADLFDRREQSLALHFEKHHCWQGSELVQAPGTPNSTSSLSYPYANELVNSLIEAVIYTNINGEDASFGADFDFRKQLYVATNMARTMSASQDVFRITLYQCAGFRKYINRTIVEWVQPGEFPKLNVAELKQNIERRQQENTIRPYYPTSTFLDKPRGRVESGLYVIGRDSQSIFWYWETDYNLETHREFETLDLAEGERIYREQFGSEVNY